MLKAVLARTEQNKIFQAIVRLVAIAVMHMFGRVQQTIKMALHEEAVFRHIAMTVMRMLWMVNPDIAVRLEATSAFPVCMLLAARSC